jgi:hypothetical protein
VYEILRNWRKQKTTPAPTTAAPAIPDAVLKKIEREIREMD